jgi:hypothetical protein
MQLSLSFSSKDGARASVVFFLHSTIFVDRLSEPRVVCRLDHRVTVIWSSTCTSLTSTLWLFGSLIACPEGKLEQECLALGEDDIILSSGLICVATSFFMIGLEIKGVSPCDPWKLSSVQQDTKIVRFISLNAKGLSSICQNISEAAYLSMQKTEYIKLEQDRSILGF